MNETLNEFFAMGGHGLYVWSAYGISLVVILWLVLRQRSARRTFLGQAQARQSRHVGERERANLPNSPPKLESHASET